MQVTYFSPSTQRLTIKFAKFYNNNNNNDNDHYYHYHHHHHYYYYNYNNYYYYYYYYYYYSKLAEFTISKNFNSQQMKPIYLLNQLSLLNF